MPSRNALWSLVSRSMSNASCKRTRCACLHPDFFRHRTWYWFSFGIRSLLNLQILTVKLSQPSSQSSAGFLCPASLPLTLKGKKFLNFAPTSEHKATLCVDTWNKTMFRGRQHLHPFTEKVFRNRLQIQFNVLGTRFCFVCSQMLESKCFLCLFNSLLLKTNSPVWTKVHLAFYSSCFSLMFRETISQCWLLSSQNENVFFAWRVLRPI